MSDGDTPASQPVEVEAASAQRLPLGPSSPEQISQRSGRDAAAIAAAQVLSRGSGLSPAEVLALQRSIGNAATARLLSRNTTSDAQTWNDPGEREWSRHAPGLIDISVKDPETGDPGFLLYNFAVNSPFVKLEHQKYLDKFFEESTLQDPKTLFPLKRIGGFSDGVRRKGGNQPLRDDRAQGVLDTLDEYADFKGIGFPKVNRGEFVKGENLKWSSSPANSTREERARNRSVFVGTYAFLPPEPKPVIPELPHTKWSVQGLTSGPIPIPKKLKLSAGVSVNLVFTRIRERVDSGPQWFEVFIGVGAGLGLPDLIEIIKALRALGNFRRIIEQLIEWSDRFGKVSLGSDAFTGEWHDFQCFKYPNGATKRDFFGRGAVTHVDVAAGSYLHISLPPRTDPPEIDLSGWQVGTAVGGGLEVGIWVPLDKEVLNSLTYKDWLRALPIPIDLP